MADGKIRIDVDINSKKATNSLKDVKKAATDLKNNLGKALKTKVEVDDKALKNVEKDVKTLKEDVDIEPNFNISKAEKEIERLKKDIDDYNGKLQKLQQGKLGNYDNTRQVINDVRKTQLSQNPSNASNINANANAQLAKLDEQYNQVLTKADEYGRKLNEADSRIETLTAQIEKAKSQQKDLTTETEKTAKNDKKVENESRKAQKSTKKHSNLWKAMQKSVKAVAANTKSLKSRLAQAVKPAENMRKKFVKIGFAMLGMRSAMAGFKQVVSSALSDNEKLQNQLTAIKGVMGQALAPAINVLLQGLSQIVSFADRLYQVFTGVSLVAKYNAQQAKKQASSTADAADAAKDLQEAQLASFDVANKLNDNSSNSSSTSGGSSSDTAAIFEKVDVSKWLNDIIDQMKNGKWEEVGKAISEKIVASLNDINWESIKSKAGKAGENFANFINGLFRYTDEDGRTLCSSVGTTIGESINTVVNTVYNFAKNLDWTKVGAELANGISSTVKTIDWNKIIKTSEISGQGLAKLIEAFFTSKDKDGDTSLDNLTKSAAKVFNSIVSFLNGLVTEWSKEDKNGETGWYKMGKSFMESLIKGILEIDFNKLGDTVKKTAKGISDLISGMFDTLNETNPDTGNTYGADLWENIGKQIVAGILAGMVAVLTLPFNKGAGNGNVFTTIFTTVYDRLCEAFGIHSPAEKMKPIGENIILGVFQGIKDWIANVGTWLKTNVFDKINEAFNKFKVKAIEITASFKEDVKNKASELKNKIESIKGKTANIIGNFKEDAKNTKKKLKDKIDDVKSKTVDVTAQFKDAITKGLNSFISRLNTVIKKLKSISVLGLQPFKGLNTIPKLAKGAIVNNPGKGVTATIGEAGREAVLPLEKNTGWMDSLADKLAERINANGQMLQTVITLDGETLAKKLSQVNNRRNIRMNGGVI